MYFKFIVFSDLIGQYFHRSVGCKVSRNFTAIFGILSHITLEQKQRIMGILESSIALEAVCVREKIKHIIVKNFKLLKF